MPSTSDARSVVGRPSLAALPAKFGVAVDGSGTLPLGDIGADIHVVCGSPSCEVMLMAREETSVVASVEVPAMVTHFALALLKHPIRRKPPPRRLPPIGSLPGGAFSIGLPFGGTTAATLTQLADLSHACGDGTLRITPWRAVIIPDVAFTATEEVAAKSAALGLIVEAADPQLAVVACPGRPACSSATVPARADALRLAGLGVAATVHVSGCAKGCAHPGPARITVVGENGRYGIVYNGGPGETPSARGLTFAQVIAALRP